MQKDLFYHIAGGKNSKLLYFTSEVLSLLTPTALCRARRDALLASIAGRPDSGEIEERAAYCCRLEPSSRTFPPPGATLPAGCPEPRRIGDMRMPKSRHVYYFDMRRHLRFFPRDFRFAAIPGDVTAVPPIPAIVKSRPISGDNANSTLLNLNRVRHFLFVRHDIPFGEKDDTAIFRGKVFNKPKRTALFERWFGAPGLDIGETWQKELTSFDWVVPPATIREQLRHKFILSIEGNEVASNLKWIMSSNSVAVSPKLEFETWFLEGQLVPGVHYVEVAPDYSDLQEKLAWYRGHPDECRKIVEAAHAHVARFADARRERLVALRVLDRYFKAIGK